MYGAAADATLRQTVASMDEIGARGPGLLKGPARAIVCLFPKLLESFQERDKVVLILLREVQVETNVVEGDGVRERCG
jgi:hypothetical protein